METFNPYQPPTADTEPEPAPAFERDRRLASRADRFGAALIDGLLAMAMLLPLQFAFHVYDDFPHFRMTVAEELIWSVVAFAEFLALHGYFLVKSSQTVGKRLLGIQIVDFHTAMRTPWQRIVLVRTLPATIASQVPTVGPFLGLLDVLFIFGRTRRCVHDLLAGTKVVKKNRLAR